MKMRHWLALILTAVTVAVALPPVFFWYYEGPRTTRADDGRWQTYSRTGAEKTIEVSSLPPAAQPTVRHVDAADQLIESVAEAAVALSSYDSVTSTGGFTVSNAHILDRLDAPFWHVFSPENMSDEVTLDPARPESLVFHKSDQELRLVGVMFMSPPGSPGPQPGGPLTRWHFHPATEFCMDDNGVPQVAAPNGIDGGCPVGLFNGPTPEMMHVWLVENPHGAFAHHMAIDDGHGEHDVWEPRNPWREFAERTYLWVAWRLGSGQTGDGDAEHER